MSYYKIIINTLMYGGLPFVLYYIWLSLTGIVLWGPVKNHFNVIEIWFYGYVFIVWITTLILVTVTLLFLLNKIIIHFNPFKNYQ